MLLFNNGKGICFRAVSILTEPIRVKEVMPMSSHTSEGITAEVARS